MIHEFLFMLLSPDVPWLAVFILFIGTEAATILIMHAAAKAAEAKAFDAGLRVGRSNTKLSDRD